jgi:hypothetical protein
MADEHPIRKSAENRFQISKVRISLYAKTRMVKRVVLRLDNPPRFFKAVFIRNASVFEGALQRLGVGTIEGESFELL